MKAKFFLTSLITLVSVAALAFGPGESRMVVVNQKNTGNYKVIYQSPNKGRVRLNIVNNHGEVVYSSSTRNTDGFMLPVNFTGMTAGEYTVEVIDAEGLTSQKLYHGVPSPINRIHVAKIAKPGKYLLSVASEGQEEIKVRIFDGANNLVHDENLAVNGSLGLVYNLTSVNGMPTFEVTDKLGNIRTIRY